MDPNSGDYAPDPQFLENDGKTFAVQAVNNDQNGNYSMAIFYYNVRYSKTSPCGHLY